MYEVSQRYLYLRLAADVNIGTFLLQFLQTAEEVGVWFYDMKADGFSLDDKRNPVADNDIPDIINRFHNLAGEEGRTRKEQSFLVPVEEIREKGYDLSINKYKEIEREKVEYESSDVILDRITSLEKDIISALNDFRTKFM